MTTQTAPRMMDSDLMHLDGGLFLAPVVTDTLIAASRISSRKDDRSLQSMSRRRFWNVGLSIAAVAYSISYLGTLAILKSTHAAAPPAQNEAAVVAEAPSTTSTSASQSAPAVTEVIARAAPQRPMTGMKPALKAGAKRETASAPSTVAASSIEPGLGINVDAAGTAIAVAARRGGKCIQPGDARTTMSVKVTFAPSGRVTTALLNGGPFLSTPEGSCIARALRSATVGPFDGGPVTVTCTVRVR